MPHRRTCHAPAPRRRLAAAALLPGLALAQAAEVAAGNPESVRAAIDAFGHKARIDLLDDGEPMIAARTADGINYVVYFYGCENGQNCLDLQFYATFTLDAPPTAQAMNDFNAEWVMGKAFVDADGAAALTFTVVGDPGMSPAYFDSVMQVWETAIGTFTEEIGW
jgi:hypothetical protein